MLVFNYYTYDMTENREWTNEAVIGGLNRCIVEVVNDGVAAGNDPAPELVVWQQACAQLYSDEIDAVQAGERALNEVAAVFPEIACPGTVDPDQLINIIDQFRTNGGLADRLQMIAGIYTVYMTMTRFGDERTALLRQAERFTQLAENISSNMTSADVAGAMAEIIWRIER